MTASTGPGERLDPRVERSRRAILEAVMTELAEVGYGALTIEGVARRAQVGKATVYRHWDGKLDLVAAAAEWAKSQIAPPDTGTPRERVRVYLGRIAVALVDSPWGCSLLAIREAARHDDAVQAMSLETSAERRALLIELLTEAQACGELGAEADPAAVAEALIGPLFLRVFMGLPLHTDDELDVVVATAFGR